MKITHKYWPSDTTHEIEFNKKDIFQKNEIRKDEILGTAKFINGILSYDYNSIPVVRDYIKCPICSIEIQIKEI